MIQPLGTLISFATMDFGYAIEKERKPHISKVSPQIVCHYSEISNPSIHPPRVYTRVDEKDFNRLIHFLRCIRMSHSFVRRCES